MNVRLTHKQALGQSNILIMRHIASNKTVASSGCARHTFPASPGAGSNTSQAATIAICRPRTDAHRGRTSIAIARWRCHGHRRAIARVSSHTTCKVSRELLANLARKTLKRARWRGSLVVRGRGSLFVCWLVRLVVWETNESRTWASIPAKEEAQECA